MSLTGPTPLPLDQNGRTVQGTYRNVASGSGTVVTSGTPVQLAAVSTEAKIIDILNPTSNSDVIVIGDSSVKFSPLKGIPVEPGFTYRLGITDLSKVWIDAAVNGSTFTYNYQW